MTTTDDRTGEADRSWWITVGDVMNRSPLTIPEGASIRDAVVLVVNGLANDLMVVGPGGTFAGLLAEGDILRRALPNREDILAAGGTVEDGYRTFVRRGGEIAGGADRRAGDPQTRPRCTRRPRRQGRGDHGRAQHPHPGGGRRRPAGGVGVARRGVRRPGAGALRREIRTMTDHSIDQGPSARAVLEAATARNAELGHENLGSLSSARGYLPAVDPLPSFPASHARLGRHGRPAAGAVRLAAGPRASGRPARPRRVGGVPAGRLPTPGRDRPRAADPRLPPGAAVEPRSHPTAPSSRVGPGQRAARPARAVPRLQRPDPLQLAEPVRR